MLKNIVRSFRDRLCSVLVRVTGRLFAKALKLQGTSRPNKREEAGQGSINFD